MCFRSSSIDDVASAGATQSPAPTQLQRLTREDGAHGGEGVYLERVHLPLGAEADGFQPHEEEARGQESDVHELADDREPQNT